MSCTTPERPERLYRVTLVDPISGETARDLGYFRESFARDFVARYRQRTAGDPGSVLVAQAVLVKKMLTSAA